MQFIKRVYDSQIVTGVIVLIALATTFYLPYVAGIRSNRWLMLGIAMLVVCCVLAGHRNIFAGLFLWYITAILYFSHTFAIYESLYMILCAAILFCAGIYTYPQWKAKRGTIYNVICVIALLNVLFECLQFYGVYILLKPPEHSIPIGLMSNPNETSALLAICLPLFFRRKWAWCLPAVALGFILARSINGIIAVAAITIIWAAIRYGWNRAAIIGTVCACILVAYGTFIDPFDFAHHARHRGQGYKISILAGSVKPFGWGFGQYEYVAPLLMNPKGLPHIQVTALIASIADKPALERAVKRITGSSDYQGASRYFADDKNNTGEVYAQAHNEYIELYFAAGIMGVLLGMAFLAWCIRTGLKQVDKLPVLCLIASAATAVFFFTWQIAPLAILTLFSLSIICGENDLDEEEVKIWQTPEKLF